MSQIVYSERRQQRHITYKEKDLSISFELNLNYQFMLYIISMLNYTMQWNYDSMITHQRQIYNKLKSQSIMIQFIIFLQLKAMASTTNTDNSQSTPDSKKYTQTRNLKSQLFIPLKYEIQQDSSNDVELGRYVMYYAQMSKQNSVVIEIFTKSSIADLIEESLKYFSQKLSGIDLNINNYEVYVSKKNGNPKTDYPSFSFDQVLSKTQNQSYSLVHVIQESTQESDKKESPIRFQKPHKKQSFQLDTQPVQKKQKRKYTDSPTREYENPGSQGSQQSYMNSLTNSKQKKNSEDGNFKELQDLNRCQKKRNWFFNFFGCGCETKLEAI